MGLRAAFCSVIAAVAVALTIPAFAQTINCTVSCAIGSDTFALPPASQPTQCKLFDSGVLVVNASVVPSGGGVACRFTRTVAEGVSVSYTAKATYAAGDSAVSAPPLVFTSSAGLPPPPPPPTTVTMGETNVLADTDNGEANYLIAQNATLSQQATLVSLSINIATASGNLRLGVYADAGGSPGALKAQTASFVPAVGWNTVAVPSTPLTPGTYWLAFLASSNALTFKMTHNSGTIKYKASIPFGALPATFAAQPATLPWHFSFYGTLNTAGAILPAPTGVRLVP